MDMINIHMYKNFKEYMKISEKLQETLQITQLRCILLVVSITSIDPHLPGSLSRVKFILSVSTLVFHTVRNLLDCLEVQSKKYLLHRIVMKIAELTRWPI